MILGADKVIALLRGHPKLHAGNRLFLRRPVLGLRDQDPGDIGAVGSVFACGSRPPMIAQ